MRSNDVCAEHSLAFDATPGAKKLRLALNGYVVESKRLLAVQKRALEERKAATEQCRRCRGAVRADGRTIVRIGRLVNLPDTVMDTLTIPGAMSDVALLAHLQALHDRVLQYKDAFEAVGMSPDLLTNLTDGITALAAARTAYAATIQDAAAATEALHENQRLARLTILALESIAPTATIADREVVKKLEVARRVGPRKDQPPDLGEAVSVAGDGMTDVNPINSMRCHSPLFKTVCWAQGPVSSPAHVDNDEPRNPFPRSGLG